MRRYLKVFKVASLCKLGQDHFNSLSEVTVGKCFDVYSLQTIDCKINDDGSLLRMTVSVQNAFIREVLIALWNKIVWECETWKAD